MGIDAEKMEAEAEAEYAELMKPTPDPDGQDKPDEVTPPADNAEPAEPVPPPVKATSDTPAENWEDKYRKAEESRLNAQALMTQATQDKAELLRQNQQLQAQMAQLQAQVDQLANSQPTADSGNDTFQSLREDYEELSPVFDELAAEKAHRQKMEQRMAQMENARREQEQQQSQESFWNEVRQAHPDLDQITATPDFQGWFQRQPDDLKQMSQVSPRGAAYVMNLYKQAAGVQTPTGTDPKQQKIQQAQQLSEPATRSRSQPTTQGRQPRLSLNELMALSAKDYAEKEQEYDAMMNYWLAHGGG